MVTLFRVTSAVRLLRSSALAATPYAYAATAPAGARLIFLAGSCPLDDHGKAVAPGDLVAQTVRCLDNLKTALRTAHADLADVISTRVLVASPARDDLVAAWDVVAATFGTHDVPSTLLGRPRRGGGGFRIASAIAGDAFLPSPGWHP